jgi:hypothetical protein
MDLFELTTLKGKLLQTANWTVYIDVLQYTAPDAAPLAIKTRDIGCQTICKKYTASDDNLSVITLLLTFLHTVWLSKICFGILLTVRAGAVSMRGARKNRFETCVRVRTFFLISNRIAYLNVDFSQQDIQLFLINARFQLQTRAEARLRRT